MKLLAVPWISLVTVPLGLLALLLHGAGSDGAIWTAVLDLAAASAALFWRFLDASAQWPGGQWYLPQPSVGVLLLALLGTVLLLLPRGVGGRAAGALLLLPLMAPRDQSPPSGDVSLLLIDVGQGQAALLRTRTHALVVDTGPRFDSGLDMGEAAVVPILRALGIENLDGLVISHGDLDRTVVRARCWLRLHLHGCCTANRPKAGGDAVRVNAGIGTVLSSKCCIRRAGFPTISTMTRAA